LRPLFSCVRFAQNQKLYIYAFSTAPEWRKSKRMSKWHEARRNSTREATENAKKEKENREPPSLGDPHHSGINQRKRSTEKRQSSRGGRGALKAGFLRRAWGGLNFFRD
jgi:hypothetical protein